MRLARSDIARILKKLKKKLLQRTYRKQARHIIPYLRGHLHNLHYFPRPFFLNRIFFCNPQEIIRVISATVVHSGRHVSPTDGAFSHLRDCALIPSDLFYRAPEKMFSKFPSLYLDWFRPLFRLTRPLPK